MKRASLIMALVAVLALGWSAHVGAADVFVAELSGAQETPPNSSGATGLMVAVMNDAQDTLTFRIDYSGLEGMSVNGSHFHDGDPGVAGPIVRGYPAGPGMEFDLADNSVTDTWTASDAQALTPALISRLYSGGIYFNIHTLPTWPGGEIRGQLMYWFSY
jgi:hypothetical protein